jgi:hypothetical protein
MFDETKWQFALSGCQVTQRSLKKSIIETTTISFFVQSSGAQCEKLIIPRRTVLRIPIRGGASLRLGTRGDCLAAHGNVHCVRFEFTEGSAEIR